MLSAAFIVLPSLVVLRTDWSGKINVHGSPDKGPAVLAMMLIGFAAAELVYLSGLIDWFYVRPHLRGVKGAVCVTSMKEWWRGVTKVWLIHRMLATLGGVAAAVAVVTLAANAWVKPVDDLAAGAIAGVATVLAGYYLTRAAPLVAIASNPPVQVGDVIQIAEEYNVHEAGKLREYFVVDISLEGVKLLQVGELDRIERSGRNSEREHDRTIDVADISRLLRRRRPVGRPCGEECQKLSRLCGCQAEWQPPLDEDNSERVR